MKLKLKTILKKYVLPGTAFLLCLLSCSCAHEKEIRRNQTNLAKIRKGMTRNQVLKIMGPPVKNQRFSPDDKVWFYYTKQAWMDGMVTRDECTPIRFDDGGRVLSWGKESNTGIYDTTRIRIQMKNSR